MKKQIFACITTLVVLAIAAPSFAADQGDKQQTMAIAAIRARVAEAQKKDERLIVRLKNGYQFSGTVGLISNEMFSVAAAHGLFGSGEAVSVYYSDIASVKGRNPFVKALKVTGTVPVVAVLAGIALPTCIVSGLFHRPVLCPCSSGSMH